MAQFDVFDSKTCCGSKISSVQLTRGKRKGHIKADIFHVFIRNRATKLHLL